ncbi:MAG: glycosyltransferase family 2 protein [Candidatus Hydrogenedentes bacterium]|nr:glycosyltransferase family 2 protein [Candidatus Hydrogenedentota bacterium]
MKLFFVIPVQDEESTVEPLARGIAAHCAGHEFTILFVDDGSTDHTFETLRRLQQEMPQVQVVRFRRNFGKSQALSAGFMRATGDVVITMDGDLQDDPAEIPRLLAKMEEGYDVVCGWKQNRHDPWHKTIPSRVYNHVVRRIFGLDLHDINTGFKAMRMDVAKRLALYGERHRLITVFAIRLGYTVAEVPVEHHPRRFGHSHYGFERFSRGALDALAVWFLDHYQHSPGHFFGRYGVVGIIAGALLCLGGVITGLSSEHFPAALVLWCTGLIIHFAGGLLLALGLLAELVVRRLPHPDPELYIESPSSKDT